MSVTFDNRFRVSTTFEVPKDEIALVKYKYY